MGEILAKRSWTRASVFTSKLLVPYGELGEFDLASSVQRPRKQLEQSRLDDRIIIGAIDLSLNVRDRTIIGWLLIEGKKSGRLQQALEATFPAEPTALQPYVIKDVADPERTLAQFYKVQFFRRTWCRVKKQVRAAKLPLTGSDLQELLSFLDGYPVGTRVLLNGVDREGKLVSSAQARNAQ